MLEKIGEKMRRKVLWIVLGAFLLLLAALLLGEFLSAGSKDADSAQARQAFIEALGWVCRADSEQMQEVRIPDCSEGAMADYNALMKAAGYDLAPYAGKTLQQYSYELENYPGYTQTVYLTLYVYEGRVVGGDIHSAALNGFMHELRPRPND